MNNLEFLARRLSDTMQSLSEEVAKTEGTRIPSEKEAKDLIQQIHTLFDLDCLTAEIAPYLKSVRFVYSLHGVRYDSLGPRYRKKVVHSKDKKDEKNAKPLVRPYYSNHTDAEHTKQSIEVVESALIYQCFAQYHLIKTLTSEEQTDYVFRLALKILLSFELDFIKHSGEVDHEHMLVNYVLSYDFLSYDEILGLVSKVLNLSLNEGIVCIPNNFGTTTTIQRASENYQSHVAKFCKEDAMDFIEECGGKCKATELAERFGLEVPAVYYYVKKYDLREYIDGYNKKEKHTKRK